MLKKTQVVLLFVFFVFLLVTILAGVLATMWETETQIRGQVRDGLISFYLAQAGIERAKIWVRHNPGVTSYTSSWFSLGGGRYRFIVSGAGPNPNRRWLQGIGQVRDSTNRVIAEKRVTVVVEGIGTPSTSDDRQRPWSWQEI